VMRDECTCQQPVVERFGRSGNAIMENMGRSSPSAKKVRDQMDNVQRHWDDLVGRLEDREKNLDAASGVTRDFQENLNHLQESLQHISDEYDHLSSDGSDADGQLKKLEDLEKQLEDQRPLLADAESVCEQLCDLLSDSGSKNEIKNKLNAVEKQYNNLNKKIENRKAELESAMKEDQEFYLSCDCIQHWLNDMEQTLGQGFPISADHDTLTRQITEFECKSSRNTRLQRCVDTSLKFHSSIKVFLPWLDQSELKLLSLPPVSFHRAQLDKQIKEIQAFKNDLSQHSQEFDNIKNLGQTLISKTDTDQIDIQDELDQLKRRWETLNKDSCNTAYTCIRGYFFTPDSCNTGLLGEARDLEKQLDQVKDSADLLITNASPSSDTSHITQEVDNLDKRHHQLTQKLREQCADLELASSVTSDFNAKLNGVHYDLNALEEELDNMAPIARDIETVQTQLDDIKDFMRRLDRVEEDVKDTSQQAQDLISQRYTSDPGSYGDHMDNMRRQLGRLEERSKTRNVNLESTLSRLEKFYGDYKETMKDLEDAVQEEKNFKIVSGDVDLIRAQQEQFQEFHKNRVAPLGAQVKDINKLGQGLVQSASSGVNTADLEQDLETLNNQWNNLKERLNEKERLLDLTLLQSGKFHEALEGVQKWLEDTEEMVSNQKPPSADYKVVKAQLQEQNFLRKLLLDRQNSMSSLSEMGAEVMRNLEDSERAQIEDQLEDLSQRFNELTAGARERTDILEQTLPVARAFQEKMTPLVEWLDQTERKLSGMATIPTDQERIRRRIEEHRDLHEDILDHKESFEDLTETVQTLMGLVGDDEAQTVVEKFQDVTDRYAKLVEDSENIGQLLAEAYEGLGNFVVTFEDLLAWMDEMESRLGRCRVLSVYVDKLQEQMYEIVELNEEIADHHTQIDSLISSAHEIMKHASGDEALQVKEKVDPLHSKFTELAQRCSERHRQALEALPITQNFHSSHETLATWMDEAERVLKTLDVSSWSHRSLRFRVLRLEAEIQEYRSHLESVNHLGPRLCQISPGEGAYAIESIVTKDNRRFDAVCEQVQRKAERIELSKQKNVEVVGDIDELLDWFREAEQQLQEAEPIYPDPDSLTAMVKEQKVLLQSVNEHKPLVDKLNKTGHALLRLCEKNDGVRVKECMDSDNSRYTALRNSLKDKQNELEEALQATSQFSDKLDGMLNALSSTADQLNNAEPISAHPDRIQDQINDNDGVLHDLSKRSPALEAVKQAANDVISKAGGDEPAVKDIRQKLDKLNDLWDTIQKSARKRGRSLEDAMALAERFWDELTAVMKALKELQEYLTTQEPPAVEPSAIQQQQEVLQEIKQEMEQTKPEVDQCRQVGQDLMQLCGEPDKPEVKKHIEDLDSAWDNVTTLYAKREQNLVDAMEKAMNFHDTLKNFLEFLDTAEDKFANLGPIGSDIESVKGQMHQLKDFKNGVDPHMVEIEALNRQAQELIERTSPSQVSMIREPMDEINHRWDELLKGIVDRQQELEHALLRLGQFQHALDELLVWISRTENTLDDLHPVFGDSQVIEVELAKHKVLMNDIQAHQTSVDTLNRAGRQLIDADRGSEDANITQKKLNDLNSRWQQLQDKAADRQRELEEALKEAQAFYQEIQDLLMWLSDTDSQLATSKPVGGLPETAREQLNRFMELYNDLDNSRYKIETVLQQGQNYLERSNDGSATNLQHNLRTLKQRWDNVLNRANDRKIKLEIALREATEFHEALQEFVEWLGNSEKYLSSVDPVSRVMNIITEQMEEHKTFQKDISSHREVMLNLDKKGTHLKYFSQKQDVILIKNLLISVQHRWERLVAKSAERTRTLDHGYKEAKEFHDAWKGLLHWLEDADKTLDSLTHIGKDPEKIKQLLSKHKEFQRALGAKQPTYDSTMKLGRTLKDKCPKSDVETLQDMLEELKNKWNSVCNKSVDRQRMLEEALLFSGQFKDAIQALIEWLDKAKDTLATDQPVHGDLDTVTSLVDQHKDLDDFLVFSLSQAEELHKAVHMLLEWLSDAEMKLRFAGPLPDDEETTRQQLEEHRRFMSEMIEQEVNKDDTIRLAQEILQKCHPDGISVIRHWITIIQSRWEEVSLWAKQREQKLQDHLRSLKDIIDLLEELMAWLIGAESSLTAAEAEPLPDEIPPLEQLIKEHEVFIDEMTQRQPDIDRVTKAFKTKHQPTQSAQKEKGGKHDDRRSSRNSSAGPTHKISTLSKSHSVGDPEIKNPRARELSEKWKDVWLLAMERQRRLQDKLNYLTEVSYYFGFC
ncbi:dystonin-like, partial [Limulus polyphemus]|uniref:Dystonin-like n=1 Tax=Limulus polyphemus TaxID=6850 RepID=A0ABM1TQ58_LIMPO